ncbi:spindle pole body formation-associated protein-domain-containing protein [Cercophora newfieldiana]|uniref:Spindle pole body formation-associated protein-domain-containing protein n=1 Tax=Cercophora newfieldiana TaxID=92897 RepID=A0AA39YFY8_9PEZI|nr:spindle pole body formation-associated protein-domain-containing protein [Cercophora newfieldiana]
MISWALRRGPSNVPDAPGPDDTTVIDMPDTPAPVFAVRALKTALFGTPAARDRASKEKTSQQTNSNPVVVQPGASPTKPAGILLTPGVGTTRRKRVSFGHGVKEGAAESNVPDAGPVKPPTPWKPRDSEDAGESISRPKTRLTQAMENSRRSGTLENVAEAKETEDAWEEVDEESEYDADVTVDLNEPHSRSGKYWKSEFETYHKDAKAEMEKLVKYKQLAKSYAKKKDEEAIDLNQKLQEEQEKVKHMEKRVSELGRQVALKAKKTGGQLDSAQMEEPSKQTALALEYKKQVEELESLLLDNADGELDDKLQRHRRIASPRTQKTLLETQRELRRARSQARELDKLREERDRLRSELKFAEQRSAKLVEENRKLSEDVTKSTSAILELEKGLREVKAETLKKEDEAQRWKKDYEKVKEDAKARYTEARQVLQKKNEKISELQEEVASLRAEAIESRWTTHAKNLDTKLKAGTETIKGPDRESALKFLETAEEESTLLLRQLSELKKVSIQRGLLAPSATAGRTKPWTRSSTENRKPDVYEDDALVSSRALREKIEAEMGQRDSWVLSDRANLQDSRSSASSGRSAYPREQEPIRLDRQTQRKSWAAGTTSATTASKAKPTIDDIVSDFRAGQERRKRAAVEKPAEKQPPVRPFSPEGEPPRIDLVQDSFAPLGGPVDTHSSAVWDISTARTNMPADRRAAAVARIQQRRSTRTRAERNKENAPF